jgi:acetolactate synthase-1/2/3 large subunit
MLKGAEIVIKCLLEEKVEIVFGYPGGAIMPIYDAMFDYQEELKHILVRHEQGAIHAAQGYARTSKKVGVCFATSGPGATNLITGLADAMIDSTPVVCVTGQVHSHLLGTDAFQETDVIGISMPVTKWNIQVTKSEDIAGAIAKAFYIAMSGRPGPVLVDITKDAQFGSAEFNYQKCNLIRSYKPQPIVNLNDVKKAIQLLDKSVKPFLLIGQGIMLSSAEDELVKFIEKSGIPVASTLLGLGAVPTNHPLYVGYVGMHGNYAPNIKTNECDLLIAIGMRFDDRVTGDVTRYAKQAKVIHIDIDASELNKIVKADVPIHGDAREVLVELIKGVKSMNYDSWLNEFRECDKVERDKISLPSINPIKDLKMAEVINKISVKTNGEAVIVTDVGQHQMITARYYKYNRTNSAISSGGLGTMGFALPAAIGASFGTKKQQVIAVIGDGGFQMTIQELGTIMQSKVDVKIVILNNNFLGMVRQWQEMFFDKRYSGTDIQNPDFIQIAKGYSIPGMKVESRNELDAGIDALLTSEGSFLLEVVVEQEDNVFPMIETGASVSEIRLS